MNPAAPKRAAKFAVQFLIRAIFVFGASVCLAMFLSSSAMAQRGSHGGGSHGGGSHGGGGHASGSHSGGHSGGGHIGGSSHATPGPARVNSSAGAEGRGASGATGSAQISLTGSADSSSTSVHNAAFVSSSATTASESAPVRIGPTTFIGDAGRMPNVPAENAAIGERPFAARNFLWQAPPSPMQPAQLQQPSQQQQQRTPPPPPPMRPVPMPVAPAPVMQPPMRAPSPAPIMIPPMATPPIMSRPMVRIPEIPPASRMVPIPQIIPKSPGVIITSPRMRPRPLPGAPRQLFPIRNSGRSRLGFGGSPNAPLPVPPRFAHITLEPGGNGRASGAALFFTPNPVPPLFCGPGFPGCGFGFDGDFDLDDGFNGPFFFFAFGGPFGFGGPCLFDGFFLNCFGGAWNGPFGWGWGTPWGYNPALTGSLYPIGGYQSPTPAEMNQASVNSIGPTTFLAAQPAQLAQLALAPAEVPLAPAAYLVTKDGIEFGVTKYWVEDNRICYVTTYNIQSCLALDQLDLQATVDINYKRGITFTLAPKQPGQPPNPPQEDPQPQHL